MTVDDYPTYEEIIKNQNIDSAEKAREQILVNDLLFQKASDVKAQMITFISEATDTMMDLTSDLSASECSVIKIYIEDMEKEYKSVEARQLYMAEFSNYLTTRFLEESK